MLLIVVEVAGTVCDADCSIFSQTVDRQRPPAIVQVPYRPANSHLGPDLQNILRFIVRLS